MKRYSSNQRTDEALKIVKMLLPEKSKEFNLQWNGEFLSGHDLYSRISRTKLTWILWVIFNRRKC